MDNIEKLQDLTIQSQYKNDNSFPNIFSYLVKSGELISPWWSRQRDEDLERFVANVDHLKSAFYKTITKLKSIKPIIEPRDLTIKSHIKQAEMYQAILFEASEMGNGYGQLISKYFWDLFTKDNGAFVEVLGDGKPNGPIEGPVLGLNNLDSSRCQRTSNPEYPVVYVDTSGYRYKLHYSRVILVSSNPSTKATMNNVGYSWATRCINVSQNLLDIMLYKQEKMGSRPLRQMMVGKGIDAEQIWDAIFQANESMDNSGLRKYAQNVIIGDSARTDIDIDIKDLASVPDGFNEKESIELGMFAIALAGGIPPRDLWPATTTGATKADAAYQHLGGSAGYESLLNEFAYQLSGNPDSKIHFGGKFLPPHLRLRYDVIDDEQDKMQSEVKEKRATTRKIGIETGVIDIRTARQQAWRAGDLAEYQFNDLELKDGRLPNGDNVLSLFMSSNDDIREMTGISIGNVLDAENNDRGLVLEQIKNAEIALMVDLSNLQSRKREAARQILRGLEELRKLYNDNPA